MNRDRGYAVRKLFVLVTLASLLPLAACFKPAQAILQPTISISIPAVSATLASGQSLIITAQVYDQSGQGVTWSVSPLNFGALSNPTFDAKSETASVTYTAPANLTISTNVTITATSITNPNVVSSITVHCSAISVQLVLQNTTLALPPQTVSPNGFVYLQAVIANDQSGLGVTWSLSPSTGLGSLFVSGPLNIYADYQAPPSVSVPTTVLVTATSVADSAVAASLQITVLPSGGGSNVAVLNVNGGPVPGQVFPNGAFTSLTICNPGSITCQTVGGILVDTGSYGLRILQSQIPQLKLGSITDPLGNALENCVSSLNGLVLWGPVERADVYIAGEAAASLPIQVIPIAPGIVPNGCSNAGVSNPNTPQLLGANGILGIGPEPTDCTLAGINYCDGSHQSTLQNVYYSCPSVGCGATASPVVVPALLQVSNPVPYFTYLYSSPISTPDGNGVVMQIPSVSDPQTSAVGTLTFGIGTESNNSLGTATVLTLDPNDHFTTTINGQTLTGSFIDSGSNALLFPDSLPACATNKQFYCPISPVMLSATNVGATQGQSTVDFTVEDADSLLSDFPQDSVFPTLAGPCSQGGAACGFVWGLPFFYGRTIYVAIDGQTVQGAPPGPWWAY